MRRLLMCSALPALLAIAPAQAAGGLAVRIDEAKQLRLNRDFGAIVIGNPHIADVTAHDPRLLFITGKAFGETNLIILDTHDNEIVNTRISVAAPASNRLTLYRGASRRSYHCPNECQAAPVPGDDGEFFGAVNGAVSDAISMAEPD